MFESVYILASVVSLCSYVMLSLQDQPRPCSENWPVLAVMWDLGMVQLHSRPHNREAPRRTKTSDLDGRG